jgi:hypothetical protein
MPPGTLAVGLRGSIVITEEATHSLAALHAAALRLNRHAVDQFVAKPLMVALASFARTALASSVSSRGSPSMAVIY